MTRRLGAVIAAAGILSAGGGSVGFAAPPPPAEARCVALAAWGEHHTKDVKVAITMNKMGLFYLGVLSGKYPDQHWGPRINQALKNDTSALAEKTQAIQGCVTRMQPYLSDGTAGVPKTT